MGVCILLMYIVGRSYWDFHKRGGLRGVDPVEKDGDDFDQETLVVEEKEKDESDDGFKVQN